MIRTVAFVLHILELVAPHFHERAQAAAELSELGRVHNFDPVLLAVIINNESDWNPGAISNDGSYGLGQPRASNFRECQADPTGEACERRKQSLLDWRTNLRVSAKLIESWKRYCRRTVGSELATAWLSGYQGFDATHHRTCGHVFSRGHWHTVEVPALTRKVLARRRELIREASR